MPANFSSNNQTGREASSNVSRFLRLIAAFVVLCVTPALYGQSQDASQAVASQDNDTQPISAVPIFSVGMAYNSFFDGGTQNVHPLVSPVITCGFAAMITDQDMRLILRFMNQ